MYSQSAVEHKLKNGFIIYDKYKWLMSSYVLDFFTENHWSRLPESWKCMKDLSTEQLTELLDPEKHSKNFILPLTILALKSYFNHNNVVRRQDEALVSPRSVWDDNKLMKLFWRNVKFKKRHEILVMAKLCHEMASKSKCFYLVDVGSGLGHLSRMLTYGYNIQMCAIEADPKLSKQAIFLDNQFNEVFHKKFIANKVTIHISKKIEPDQTPQDFLKLIKSSLNIENDNVEFGIVGLHPCGDLGPTLLRLFAKLPNVKFINVAGCCYMKLSNIGSTVSPGFPMSEFGKRNRLDLCYHSKEIACHAIENYISKLYQGEAWKLKIHAYRATIEKILTEIDPQLKHVPLANVKYTENLDFESYCRKATAKLLGNFIDVSRMKSGDILECLSNWRYVVIFYSLRLFFAPFLESLILYDRMMYLRENGCDVELISGFDCIISPRLHIVQGRKS